MAGKLKLKNANGKQLSIANNDSNTKDINVSYFSSVGDLTSATGLDGDVAYLSDIDRGGDFVYDSSAVDNSIDVLGKWVRTGSKSDKSKSKLLFFKENNDSTALTTIVAEESRYRTFPMVSANSKGVMIMTYHDQEQHVGGGLSDLCAKVSYDGGASWSNKITVYGNYTGGDSYEPFWSGLGTNSNNEFVLVFGITEPSGNKPYLTKSFDGITWSEPVKLTIANDPSPTGSLQIFGELSLLPDGKMLMSAFISDTNGLLTIDTNSNTASYIEVINTSDAGTENGRSYSEAVILVVSQKTWYYFIRWDGSATTVPYHVTTDGGATWNYLGETGDNPGGDFDNSGGWLPQAAAIVDDTNGLNILLAMGVRPTASAPYTGAPAIVYFKAKESLVFTNSTTWEAIHTVPLSDTVDGNHDLDAYNSMIVQSDSTIFTVCNDETVYQEESAIKSFSFNARDHQNVTTQEVLSAEISLVGDSDVANNVSGLPSIKYIKSGNIVTFYGGLTVTSIVSSGPLRVVGLPFTMSSNFQTLAVFAYRADSGKENIGMRSINGTGEFQLMEGFTGSNLDSSEVADNFNLRFSGSIIVD